MSEATAVTLSCSHVLNMISLNFITVSNSEGRSKMYTHNGPSGGRWCGKKDAKKHFTCFPEDLKEGRMTLCDDPNQGCVS